MSWWTPLSVNEASTCYCLVLLEGCEEGCMPRRPDARAVFRLYNGVHMGNLLQKWHVQHLYDLMLRREGWWMVLLTALPKLFLQFRKRVSYLQCYCFEEWDGLLVHLQGGLIFCWEESSAVIQSSFLLFIVVSHGIIRKCWKPPFQRKKDNDRKH